MSQDIGPYGVDLVNDSVSHLHFLRFMQVYNFSNNIEALILLPIGSALSCRSMEKDSMQARLS